jgi:integrase
MARTVKVAKIDSRTARNKLEKGRQPAWEKLHDRVHLGYQRWKGDESGRWLLRRYLGGGNKYRVMALGTADDTNAANGVSVLNYDQAKAKALAMVETPDADKKIQNITVRQATERYIKFKLGEGQPVDDAISSSRVHILPQLGDLVVSQLTDDILRQWRNNLANSPAQLRSKAGTPQYRAKAEDDEAIRKRRATANRVLTTLKAILNKAFDDKQVSNRDAWGRRLKPFPGVDRARIRYLEIAEAVRLINSCEPEFRPLVRAALETGARYSELARLEVVDFNSDSETLAVRKSKSGKSRNIILTKEGATFFRQYCVGRNRSEKMFTHTSVTGKVIPWKKSEQTERMNLANERAKIDPPVSFHILRHTWASHSVMNRVPLIVVAQNLGHRDTTMVEKHYGHLAKSYVTDAIRAGAPVYGVTETTNVRTIR